MPSYTLYYFPVKALGESIRLLLSYGGQEFEDKRISQDEWPKYKPKMKFGQMPVLEIDGKQHAQCFAVSRFLGHKYGVAGKTLEEDYQIDEVVDFVNDIRSKAASVQYESNEQVKEARHKEFSETLYPGLLAKLDQIIGDNNGYLALGRLTWADFFFVGFFDYLKMMMRIPDLETKYPNFKKVLDNVLNLPQVKAYYAKAPKADF